MWSYVEVDGKRGHAALRPLARSATPCPWRESGPLRPSSAAAVGPGLSTVGPRSPGVVVSARRVVGRACKNKDHPPSPVFRVAHRHTRGEGGHGILNSVWPTPRDSACRGRRWRLHFLSGPDDQARFLQPRTPDAAHTSPAEPPGACGLGSTRRVRGCAPPCPLPPFPAAPPPPCLNAARFMTMAPVLCGGNKIRVRGSQTRQDRHQPGPILRGRRSLGEQEVEHLET
ncbi:hypothetical protein F5X68DRAFT_15073 [Plectosphaerella plurivora]|uniref:Uncharacterized protein n=1 Tax=Plectosphaerella plurivora TaxID=936078 RepID=A0A9P8VA00_9PEZI|nr:hypothetical protein F5X68DRAFT_15073 [Plectosphaerella plurivora]